jgi:predicted ATPase
VRSDLPSGTVTFLFTDVEGSTQLLHELGAEAYADALAEHRRVIREACAAHDGVEVDTQGDAFFFAFPTAPGALAAASRMTEALASGPIQVRAGLHTGTPLVTEEGYIGDDVHLGARVASASHGGQVVLSQATAQLIELELTDLGEHRLKDIPEAVPIYQLGNGTFPPLKTISNTNLPRPASSFVGREQETGAVVDLLKNGARLVTLSGPGGSGKTRLAIEAASELVPEFKAGVFWVGLAALRDPALVTETIAQTLGAKDGLDEHIAERELLLLVDNLEQVIDAAPELGSLLEACPNLKLLVTSRELLRVRGEVEYAVPPLEEQEAADLFCERSQLEADETIAELCRRLDSLPLAVELAAARTSVLSPQQILERLSQRLDLLKGGRDADPRQLTLRATIEWSYEMLSRGEQELFARLSVFAGGCTLEAAEEVAEADLDTLQSLVDKSLLRFTDERYWMLETIREYATERLSESGEPEQLRRNHADFFLAIALQAEQILRGSDREDALERLEREHDNLRAAHDSLEWLGEGELASRLAGALFVFWWMNGHMVEGRRRLERALEDHTGATRARASALNGASLMALEAGDIETARMRIEEALPIFLKLGDTWGVTDAHFQLALIAVHARDPVRALELFEVSAEDFRRLGDEHMAMVATNNLADGYADVGELVRARELHEENLGRAREVGNRRIATFALGSLARIAIDEQRFDDALEALSETLSSLREGRDPRLLSLHLFLAARALAGRGQAEVAAALLSAADAARRELGYGLEPRDEDGNEQAIVLMRSALGERRLAQAQREGETLTLQDAVSLALDSLD